MAAVLTLVLGGARSGKSRYAESLIAVLPPPWAYVATAEAGDHEMAVRIRAHRARRGPSWRTIEAPRDLTAAFAACERMPVLVDCLTLWLSNLHARRRRRQRRSRTFGRSAGGKLLHRWCWWRTKSAPESCRTIALGRKFRDLQGLLNQRIAARADRVVLMVAGLPLALKGAL